MKKGKLKKIWDFLWHSNSIWSWIIDFILIFILVKFIIFPLLSLLLCSSMPFVIVDGGSMEHKISVSGTDATPKLCGTYFNKTKDLSSDLDIYWGICGDWYETHNTSKDEFETWPYHNGLNMGDIIVVRGVKDNNYKIGDIIIFRISQRKTPIIHRIVSVEETENKKVFLTKGDHNHGQDPSNDQIIGRAVFRIPKIGWFKLFFAGLFR